MKAEDRRLLEALAASLRKDGWHVTEIPTSFSMLVMPESTTTTQHDLSPGLGFRLRIVEVRR